MTTTLTLVTSPSAEGQDEAPEPTSPVWLKWRGPSVSNCASTPTSAGFSSDSFSGHESVGSGSGDEHASQTSKSSQQIRRPPGLEQDPWRDEPAKLVSWGNQQPEHDKTYSTLTSLTPHLADPQVKPKRSRPPKFIRERAKRRQEREQAMASETNAAVPPMMLTERLAVGDHREPMPYMLPAPFPPLFPRPGYPSYSALPHAFQSVPRDLMAPLHHRGAQPSSAMNRVPTCLPANPGLAPR